MYCTKAPNLRSYDSHLSHLFFIITSSPPEMSVYLLKNFPPKWQWHFFLLMNLILRIIFWQLEIKCLRKSYLLKTHIKSSCSSSLVLSCFCSLQKWISKALDKIACSCEWGHLFQREQCSIKTCFYHLWYIYILSTLLLLQAINEEFWPYLYCTKITFFLCLSIP